MEENKTKATPALLKRYLEQNSIHYFLEGDSNHIFVRNTAASDKNAHGKVAVIIPIDDKLTCKIPSTRLPFDLTEQAPASRILESPLFRKCLQSGALTIVDAEEALQILDTQEARTERSRLKELVPNLSDVYSIQNEVTVAEPAMADTKQANRLTQNLVLVETLAASDLSDEQKFVAVRNIEDQLEPDDWTYCLEHTEYEPLKTLAGSHL